METVIQTMMVMMKLDFKILYFNYFTPYGFGAVSRTQLNDDDSCKVLVK
jgi:hypothetical protein